MYAYVTAVCTLSTYGYGRACSETDGFKALDKGSRKGAGDERTV